MPYNLWYFVRRAGKQIKSKEDDIWLEIGITAALIDGGRGDFRDLIFSLISLCSDAEKHGIDPKPYFAEPVQRADERMQYILTTARDEKKRLLIFWVVVVLGLLGLIFICLFLNNIIGN